MTRAQPGVRLPADAAARRLGVSARVLRCYTRDEKLPGVRGPGGRRIFWAGNLHAVFGKGARQGPSVGYPRVCSRRQQAEGAGRLYGRRPVRARGLRDAAAAGTRASQDTA